MMMGRIMIASFHSFVVLVVAVITTVVCPSYHSSREIHHTTPVNLLLIAILLFIDFDYSTPIYIRIELSLLIHSHCPNLSSLRWVVMRQMFVCCIG